jgi:phospholipase C
MASAAAAAAYAALAPAAALAEPKPKTPIEHFLVLMQENHSFDNYFGTYPGANGIPPNACQPTRVTQPHGRCVRPFHLGNAAVQDLNHGQRVAIRQYAKGRMNGFVDAQRRESGNVEQIVMGHYDDRDIPYYWNLADEYVLFDSFFSSALGGSVGNHMYWVTGTPGNPRGDFIPADGFHQTTIFDRLEEKGISWKFYVQNYDPEINFRNRAIGDRGSQVVWVPLLDYARFLDDPKLSKRIVDLSEYYRDLERGTLPAVAYMAPSGSSEHPPGNIRAGERFVRTIINSLMRSRYWAKSAFMWTYDDWGGWYDHVPPPRVDRHGYGFRVPALLVSPYAKRGHLEHTQLDFTSILKFIERNWGLEPLAERDRKANSIGSAFDFSQGARKPKFLAAHRVRAPTAEPRRAPIYGAYTLALAITALVVAAAAFGGRPSRRWRARSRGRATP